MALKLELDTNIGIKADYLKIKAIHNEGMESTVQIQVYVSKDARDLNAQPIQYLERRIPKVFSFSDAYTELKKVNGFEIALDC
jgi:exoribonuclease II